MLVLFFFRYSGFRESSVNRHKIYSLWLWAQNVDCLPLHWISPEQVQIIVGHSSSCSKLIRHQTSAHDSDSLVEVVAQMVLSALIGCAYAAGAVNNSTCVYCAAGTFSTTAGEKASSCHIVVGLCF